MNTETKNTTNDQQAENPGSENQEPVKAVEDAKWGELPADNFGYASDEERRAKRGLEDWELIDAIPDLIDPIFS